jgi:diaminohydroxyphosphoribosylaminopyrimidine deaminase/5-amino-6-(5-phosphoribosylamino)uracil reductase
MEDARWMRAAIALGRRGRGRTASNPNVGCVIVNKDTVVGRGWTQPGGRPHAEAMALDMAGPAARGATAYVTLEPCAHVSDRGATCSNLLIEAGIAHVVIAALDPDPRTDGKGADRLRDAGVDVAVGLLVEEAERSMAGFFSRQRRGRPFITLKLAMSLDGKIALPSGESRWITGEAARRHVHLQRARSDMVVVGRGTYDADAPMLDVRIEGLEHRSPRRAVLTGGDVAEGWLRLSSPQDVFGLADVNDLMVEGGAGAGAAFLAADLVDRLMIYRAPILIGEGKAALAGIGLHSLADAHNRWKLDRGRMLGSDRLEVYERA